MLSIKALGALHGPKGLSHLARHVPKFILTDALLGNHKRQSGKTAAVERTAHGLSHGAKIFVITVKFDRIMAAAECIGSSFYELVKLLWGRMETWRERSGTYSRETVAIRMHHKSEHRKRTEESVHELISRMVERGTSACCHDKHSSELFF